jgi:hypothetical protein
MALAPFAGRRNEWLGFARFIVLVVAVINHLKTSIKGMTYMLRMLFSSSLGAKHFLPPTPLFARQQFMMASQRALSNQARQKEERP